MTYIHYSYKQKILPLKTAGFFVYKETYFFYPSLVKI